MSDTIPVTPAPKRSFAATAVLIFGLQPAALIGAVQTILVLAISYGWLDGIGLDSKADVAIVVGVLSALSAVWTAYKTNKTILSPLIQLFQACLSLAALYGFHMTSQQSGFVVAAITVIAALFHATQTTPLAKGNFRLCA